MGYLAHVVRAACSRIKFFLIDRFYFALWAGRFVVIALFRAPVALLQFLYFEFMGFTVWLRESLHGLRMWSRRAFAVGGPGYWAWQIRRALWGLISIPRGAVRILIREAQNLLHGLIDGIRRLTGGVKRAPKKTTQVLVSESSGLVFGIFHGVRLGLKFVIRQFKNLLRLIFVTPFAWTFTIASDQCCNATLQHSRARGKEWIWRWFLIGLYRCRFCSGRSRRFWPVVDRKLRIKAEAARQSRETQSSQETSSTAAAKPGS